MAHVLIGWELGAYGGHLARIRRVGAALAGAGHRVTLALQRIDAPGLREEPWVDRIWQTPLWPSLLGSVGRAVAGPSATMGDILGSAGLLRPGTFARLLAGWAPILAADPPDVVIGDYAPALLCAARGRCPTVALGDAFDVPPTHLQRFPSLTGKPPVVEEGLLLAEVNAGLVATGLPPIGALAELFRSDLPLPASFAILDPYAVWRTGPLYQPFIDPLVAATDPMMPSGEEVFVYWPGTGDGTLALWQALSGLKRPVRVHAPQLTPGDHRWMAQQGLAVEAQPVPFPLIARRSRLLVSHGGIGFVSTGILAGLPQLVVALDLQKRLVGEGVARAGAGAVLPADADADTIGRLVAQLADDPALQDRARNLGEGLRASPAVLPEAELVAAVSDWVG